MMKNKIIVYFAGCCLLLQVMAAAQDLPVSPPQSQPLETGIRNSITLQQVRNITGPSKDGGSLLIDLKDESLFGFVYSGPYPFEQHEADYDYARFRIKKSIVKGRGEIPCLHYLAYDTLNANDWPLPTMTVAYRLELYRAVEDGTAKPLGFYDSRVSFEVITSAGDKPRTEVRRKLTLVEGPFVGLLTSDAPNQGLITWQTDQACDATLHLTPESGETTALHCAADSGRPLSDGDSFQYEQPLTGLQPDTPYTYSIQCRATDGRVTQTDSYSFKTAPRPGEGSVVFGFASDSREGVGGGEQTYMGHNKALFQRIAQQLFRRGADFFLFGGDLVNGYTTDTEDFRLQMRGWKQSLAGFWRGRCVYPIMGNHEALLKTFPGLAMDKWPYETDSAEAVFAEQFWNPKNGPEPEDPRRPTYKENVYHFQYGPVLAIGFNNNYWWSTNNNCKYNGGCPEGYLLEDQLAWIERTLAEAEKNRTVKYIVVYAQEPVFPCGGHVGDCMWWNGNNHLRAYTFKDGTLVGEKAGMIEVRNRFWTALASSTKVVAVMSGDEHVYHRLLVDNRTPVGVMALDDQNGNNVLDDGQFSPNPAFTSPIWHITAGTAGAPYYAREKTPWQPEVFSSQTGYCLFTATPERISLSFYSLTGQVIDRVDDLMAVKK